MREFTVLHDTWIGGKPVAKDTIVSLEEGDAKGLVKAGLIVEVGHEAKPAAKGKAG